MAPNNEPPVQVLPPETLAPAIPLEFAETSEDSSIDVQKAALYFIAVPAAAFFLRYAAEVFIPIVLAVLIGYALDPLVTKLCHWHVPRAAAALLVIFAVLGGLGSTAYLLRNPFIAGLESLPETARRIRYTVEASLDGSDGSSALNKIKEAASEIEKTADAAAAPAPPKAGIGRSQGDQRSTIGDYFWKGSVGVVGVATQAGVVIFLVFFLLASGDLYRRKLVRIIGSDFAQKRITVEALHEIDRQIERFLVVQIAISVLVALATWVCLDLLGIAQPMIWGIAAGVLNFIPYLGAIIAAVGLGVVAFGQFGTLEAAGAVAGVVLLIRIVEGGLLTPLLMGRAAGINGVALFISLLFWGWLWGIIGLLVAVPIMMIIKTACERIEGLKSIGELLNQK